VADAPSRLLATVLTHKGAERAGNEDAVVVGTRTFAGVSSHRPDVVAVPLDGSIVVAVADGLGGHAAGEVASRIAVERLATYDATTAGKDDLSSLLRDVSDEILAEGRQNRAQAGMGTTVVGLLVRAEDTTWFNVGDSRAYLLAGGYLAQLSVDDTPAGALAEPGESPPPTSVVTQVLGDTQGAITPHVGIQPVGDDDAYLLCSDGLSDLVELEEMERLLRDADEDVTAVSSLWRAAMDAGGRDNITIVLVRRDR
jgi:serine/threonine protein phosphatase PrpC